VGRDEANHFSQIVMVKLSAVGPGTEIGKQILEDFKNWKVTGFKPWGTGVGGANHYNSSQKYKAVSASAFRSQAKKIAKLALEQMPVCDVLDESEVYDDNKLENKAGRKTETGDEKSLPVDSEIRNPWINCDNHVKPNCRRMTEQGQDYSDEDDCDYTFSDEETTSDNDLEGFEDVELGELQNSRDPFFSEYPTGDKVLAIFPLDGNVRDTNANQFEFIEDNTAIQRWGKVPKERESCVALIGLGTKKLSKMGFSEVDLMVVDAEIQKRLKANNYRRDKNGDIWEIRARLKLPFKCIPKLYAKNGKTLTTFRMRSNGRGFSWGYFWLLAWNPPEPKPAKRIGGRLVTTMSKEDSSMYTEKTYESRKR
jgi:hypothetical protein